jgi:glycosyltransferase involved in cell wall biosynthesis
LADTAHWAAGSAPTVSVVLAIRDGGQQLDATLDSVLEQSFRDFELIVVDDGSSDPLVAGVLRQHALRDHRVRTLEAPKRGLTAALIAGCEAARGPLIARVDNGDRMSPDRLAKQVDVMRRFPDCVLVTCKTGFYGPKWEHLWSTTADPMAAPVPAFCASAPNGIAVPISHHGSVVFRTSAYRTAGGYRREFCLGQDWDLWYRLAERGTFFCIAETLYQARVFPESLSMSRTALQRRFAALSLGACTARRRGGSEASFIAAAAELSKSISSASRRSSRSSGAAGYHFIGEALRRNRDRACRSYLAMAVRKRPWSPRSWLRFFQSYLVRLLPPSRVSL